MTFRKTLGVIPSAIAMASVAAGAAADETPPAIDPPEIVVAFRIDDFRKGETEVDIKTTSAIVEDNGLFRRVETVMAFTNPNRRPFAGELEFPLPPAAVVCGYELEVGGVMVKGVVCEKEKARVAFENEQRKGVDPGVVENVKGNIWRTRIYPLLPGVERKAKLSYVVENEKPVADIVFERDGDTVFAGEATDAASGAKTAADLLRSAETGWILWDASYSRAGKTQSDRNLLECLPEKGEWTLVVFRDIPEEPVRFTSRAELLKAVDSVSYDGGTSFARLASILGEGTKFIFSDEIDTLSVKAPDFDTDPSVVFASRPKAAARRINVRKLADGEKVTGEIRESRLLATIWAATRISDLAAQADQRKDEFLALGRKYGVAGPGMSLIVLENLDQYLTYKIEPPETLPFYAEWKRLRAAEDDEIRGEEARSEHRQRLLALWKERVEWWNSPIPPKKTPKSGLFEVQARQLARSAPPPAVEAVAADEEIVMMSDNAAFETAAPAADSVAPRASLFVAKPSSRGPGDAEKRPGEAEAVVKIAAWDPKMPYLDALRKAGADCAYSEYLKQRTVYGNSPAFYLDCAGYFFKANKQVLAARILSNLAEMKLEDAALWRTMGWRLREAGVYDAAVDVFRHVLEMRGEEAQSRRDLALVLAERGKEFFAAGKMDAAEKDIAEALRFFRDAAFSTTARRSARRSNDMQVSIIALEELNGLLSWIAANGLKVDVPELDSAFRRDMPVDLRIVMSWDTDETDIDIHVLEPDGEEAFYGHRRTSSGGFVSEDVTTGYGPEEYLSKNAAKGLYKILSNYFASHQQQLTGPTIVTATVYTGWGTKGEKREILSFRLDKAKDKHPIGEITIK